jgi:hypothetical protein
VRGRAAGYEPASEVLVEEDARHQSSGGAARAYNHDALWACSKGTVEEDASKVVLSPWWLQLCDGLASHPPRHAIRKASMEKGLLFFIMK